MLIIPKKDFPKDLNPTGLKRGDHITIEVSDATPDYITVDPATLKLHLMRDASEPRDPLHKQAKPKNAANMPLPDLKSMIQKPPMAPPPAPSAGPAPTTPPPPAPMPPMK